MENEGIIRLGIFFGLFAVFALAEAMKPRRKRNLPRASRWVTNWSISILNTVTTNLMAIVLPALAIGAAMDAEAQGWGLFNRWGIEGWIEVVLVVLVFDFAIWLQHLVTHKIPILWRLHRVHHSDRDFDVTTAIRFHPVEIALSMLLKIGLVYLLGPSALGILIFEVMLNGTAMFNHSNLSLPTSIDRFLRLFIVTPDMHRVHHSVNRHEHDSNYGFALVIWDRLLRTYRDQPEHGHEGMTLGLQWQDDRPARLGWSLALPFFRK